MITNYDHCLRFQVLDKRISFLDSLTPEVVADNRGCVCIHIDFDNQWDGVGKIARFIYESKWKDVVLDVDGECICPSEVIKKGRFLLGVYGADLKSSTPIAVTVAASILTESGEELPEDPTPGIYDQILQQYQATCEAASEVEQAAWDTIEQSKQAIESLNAARADIGKIEERFNAKADEIDEAFMRTGPIYDLLWENLDSKNFFSPQSVVLGAKVMSQYDYFKITYKQKSGSAYDQYYVLLDNTPGVVDDKYATGASGGYMTSQMLEVIEQSTTPIRRLCYVTKTTEPGDTIKFLEANYWNEAEHSYYYENAYLIPCKIYGVKHVAVGPIDHIKADNQLEHDLNPATVSYYKTAVYTVQDGSVLMAVEKDDSHRTGSHRVTNARLATGELSLEEYDPREEEIANQGVKITGVKTPDGKDPSQAANVEYVKDSIENGVGKLAIQSQADSKSPIFKSSVEADTDVIRMSVSCDERPTGNDRYRESFLHFSPGWIYVGTYDETYGEDPIAIHGVRTPDDANLFPYYVASTGYVQKCATELKDSLAAAIRKTKAGTTVVLDDISPVTHTIKIKMHQNMITYPYAFVNAKSYSGVVVNDMGDGSVYIRGKATGGNAYIPLNNGVDFGSQDLKVEDNEYATNGEYTASKWVYYKAKGKWVNIFIPEGTVVDEIVQPVFFKNIEESDDVQIIVNGKTYHMGENGVVEAESAYPTTTITSNINGAALEVDYIVDTKKYIDGKFAELQALILEV